MFTILWITLSWTALLHAVYMHQIDMLFNFKSVDQINYNPYLQTMISSSAGYNRTKRQISNLVLHNTNVALKLNA